MHHDRCLGPYFVLQTGRPGPKEWPAMGRGPAGGAMGTRWWPVRMRKSAGWLSLAPSLTALFLCLAVWGWGMEAPLLQSHMKPVTWRPAVGPGPKEGGAGFRTSSSTPTCLLATLRAVSPATHPIYQAGRAPCEPARGGGGGQGTSVLQWLLGSGVPSSHRSLQAPTGVDSVVQWLALRFWSKGLNPCFTAPESLT